MPEHYRYSLPVKAGDQRQLGELTGAAQAVECAENRRAPPWPGDADRPGYAKRPAPARRDSPVHRSAGDQPGRLGNAALRQLLAAPGDHLLPPVDPLSAADHAARRADCAGQYPDAARLPAQLSARPRAGDEKRPAPVPRCPARAAGAVPVIATSTR